MCVCVYEKIPTDIKAVHSICVRLCYMQRESVTDTYSSIEMRVCVCKGYVQP